MFRFQDTSWLQILIILPFMVGFTFFFYARQRKKIVAAFGERLTPFLTANVSQVRRKWKLILEALVLVLMVVALARPQMGQGKQNIKSRGVELILALDVSNSMLAEDQKPNRLTLAKKELNRLLDKLTGDRIGLIAFAGTSVLVSPLTNDYSSIRMFLDSLSPESVSTQGTSFAHVIDTALSAFKRGGVSDDENSHVTRVLLLATDGEVQDNTAMKLADAASKQGIRIFTLGMGTRAGAPIPMRDDRGNLEGYKKDKRGQIITTAADDEVLAKLASAGHGNYQHSTFTGEEIDAIVRDIDKLEKSTFDSKEAESYNEFFQLPLLCALVLLILELLLADRKANSGNWKGRFEVSSLLLIFGLFGSRLANAASSESPRAIWENNHAAKLLDAQLEEEAEKLKVATQEGGAPGERESGQAQPVKKPSARSNSGSILEVRDRLLRAVGADNENAVVHFNLGIAFEQMKDRENAIKELQTAARLAKDNDVKFAALYNVGVLYGQDQKIDEAVTSYLEALKVNPDSKETKTNIELLFSEKSGGGGKDQKQPSKGDKGDGKREQPKPDQGKPEQQPQSSQKQQPKPYEGKDISKQDVDKILDELKRQEEQIRGRLNDKQHHDPAPDKDW